MNSELDQLRSAVECAYEGRFDLESMPELLAKFRSALNRGIIRVAELSGSRWVVHEWLKKGILLHAKTASLIDISDGQGLRFDFDTLPQRRFELADRVRVCAGTVVRDGCYIGEGVSIMPGSTVNIGAWIGEQSAV
ncbi:MAG: hypothetical protein JO336_07970, partial [Acidobacteriia bacterium]|nr:hypothetical protein [Terriglobia bacterium]